MQSLNNFNQQEEEKLILELFRQEYEDFPKGKIVKSESPDFILRNTIKISTGIELTKLHGPNSNKQQTHFSKGDSTYIPPEPSFENIEFTIQSKEEKLHLYKRKRLTKIWLIITADLSTSPITYNLDNKLSNWQFNSNFDEVFLFELMSRRVFAIL